MPIGHRGAHQGAATVPANIYGPLDRGITVLQLCRWKFSHKKLCSRLYSIEVDLYSKKTKKRFLSHTLGNLGVTYALHL